MKKIYFSLVLLTLSFITGNAIAQSTTYTYTGSVQTYTVPVGATAISVDVRGAQGGNYPGRGQGGLGGQVTAKLAVTPGQVFYVYVGQQGTPSCYPSCGYVVPPGGSNSGGGAQGGAGSYSEGGGAGGGASDIRTTSGSNTAALNSRIIVGGAGGGGAYDCTSGNGGVGGGSSGGTGTNSCFGGYNSTSEGGPGTQSAGGFAGYGYSSSYYYGGPATSGARGHGGNACPGYFGGGGGGGLFGGGGAYEGGACGGSSTPLTGASSAVFSSVVNTAGVQTGNGQVTITVLCTTPGTITGGSAVCMGSALTLADATAGGAGTWSSSNPGVATINSSTGVVTTVGTGTTTITYNVVTPCGASATEVLTVNPVPAISGVPVACTAGGTTTLTSSVSGGTWTSGNTGLATVNSSGVVFGVAAGSPIISYSVPTGCGPATIVATINAQPAAIAGTTTVCGSLTTLLSDATSGGTWSSSNGALATVGSASGLVTGVGAGNPTITYTAATGCTSTTLITVNALSAITGSPAMCVGGTTLLSDATSGGTWSSSNTAVATVNSSGLVTSVTLGTTTISYSIASSGCTAVISTAVTTTPSVFTVSGGGSFCSGAAASTGPHIFLNSSNSGVSYQLFNGAFAVGTPITGSGLIIDFGTFTTPGTYGIIANTGSTCQTTMSGSAILTALPLPTPFTVSGGGGYCTGTGGTHVFLNSSTIGISYQLFVTTSGGTIPVGSSVAGTSAILDFGAQTIAGVYTVIGTNNSTGCTGNMSGSVTVTINLPPPANNVTLNGVAGGTGGYCSGGTSTVTVGLNGSVTGKKYQLLYAGTPLGAPVSGTGAALVFGIETLPGAYTVKATDSITGCTATMTGTVNVVVNPLPSVFTVTGGGNYCSGAIPAGVAVGLNGSSTGVNYQLFVTTTGTVAVGSAVAGTGSAISFGLQPTAGSYTVVATSTSGCTSNMSGSVAVIINPLPNTALTVTGGGNICAGATGLPIGLNGSTTGTTYQLLANGSLAGALSGTGFALAFGLETIPGVYTVVATTTATGCTATIGSSANIIVNPLPTATFNVTAGGTAGATVSYCSGGTGVTIGLNGSQSGITYQLYNAGIALTGSGTSLTGSGPALSFGLKTAAGTYTVIGTSGSGCSSTMAGSGTVAINPLPTQYNVTGGGGFCTGGTGAHIGLSASNAGITYTLMNGTTPALAPVFGTGAPIDFGLLTTLATYTVLATNATTTCTVSMTGSATVSNNALPGIFSMSSSGSYCNGGTGWPVILSGSVSGINYQLLRNGVPVPGGLGLLPGTSAPLNFGLQTVAGTYTVIATNPATGCTSNMTGNTTISVNSLPIVYVATGGGGYCPGSGGVHVGLSASSIGVNYQLYNSLVPTGAPLHGNGSALDFGGQTIPGTYNVVAIDTITHCTNNMTGLVTVTVNPTPPLYTMTGGGGYCFGGTGKDIGLSGSTIGVNYQLMTAASPIGVPLAGTGLPLDFGLQTANGIYTVVATYPSSGCTSNMAGTATIVVTPMPSLFTVTGGGNHCPGDTGVHIRLSGSTAGISYQVFLGPTATGAPVIGTGSAIDLGLYTTPGTYNVVATNPTSTCTSAMTGAVLVGFSPLPVVYNVLGGGNYCPTGSGVNIGLSGSNTGVTYQLFNDVTPMGSVAGTGLPITFGLQTAMGTYTVVAKSIATNCTSNMAGSATVGLFTPPATFNITGGGNYCSGTGGLHVGVDGSELGTSYQLFRGVASIAAPIAGTGGALDFGAQTSAGTYTIVATNTTTTCTSTMSGSVAIIINPLPIAHTVTGGGNYCSGSNGVNVGLNTSDVGVYYQLFNGILPEGAPVAGTGSAISFGPQTLGGTYTVVGTSTGTSCMNNMTGSVLITINPVPTVYSVTGGGNYCPAGAGVHVGLAGSGTGISYQLYRDLAITGAPIAGNGSPLDFGMQTGTGSYQIVATNIVTGCADTMMGSVTVGISALPAVYALSSSSSNYCAGGTGVDLTLSGSDVGTNYQLAVGGVPMGAPIAGTGFGMDLGLQTAAGSYSVIATNGSACTSIMSGGVSIAINPLPTPYSVVGGGDYCSGGTGVNIGLSNSHVGISYQLYNGVGPIGSPVLGSGSPLNFGANTNAGIYTVIATNLATSCANTMSGSATVAIDPLPTLYSLTGGGNYCAGSDGVHVGLSGSATGVTYQLHNGGTLVGGPALGSGTALDFGVQTTAGAYTVIATSASTGCNNTMDGTAVVGINTLPVAYVVTGGGNDCPGGAGFHVGIVGSNLGVTYQLFNGSLMVGAPVAGTGSAIDFGMKTAAGIYTVVGTNTTTLCTNNMAGSATIAINPLPAVFNVTGGGNYCTGGTGVLVGLVGSGAGISYQLFNGVTATGFPVSGTGGAIDFGLQTAPGVYSVVATNATTSCASNMSGTKTIVVNPLVAPSITVSTGVGDTLCAGNLVTINALVSNQGSSPTYNWTVNGAPAAAVGTSYTYTPSNGDVVGVVLNSSATCATPPMVNASLTLTVLPNEMPTITVASDVSGAICQGTTVNFTATTTFGGTPGYSWIVNGVNQSTAAAYSYIPGNNDVVYCQLSSSYQCRLANSVPSNHITMTVDVPTVPDVTVTAHPGANIALGQTVTLSATLNNDVIAPAYQWFVNGEPVPGADMPTFSSNNFSNNDSVSCVVTSGGVCVGKTGSNSVVLHIANVGVKQITPTAGDITLVPNPNNGIFTIKGSIGTTNDQEVAVEITDMLGQVIYNSKVMVHGGNINEKIQLNSTVANGMYILNLNTGSENKVFHVVIEQ